MGPVAPVAPDGPDGPVGPVGPAAPPPLTPENIKEFPSAETTTDCPALPSEPGVSIRSINSEAEGVMPENTNSVPETTTTCPSPPKEEAVSVKSTKVEEPPPPPTTPENTKELPSEPTTTDWPTAP